MLTPNELAAIRRENQNLYNLLLTLIDAANKTGINAGLDPRPSPQTDPAKALPPPLGPATLTATAFGNLVLLVLTPGADTLESALFFIEQATVSTFPSVVTYALGHARQVSLVLTAGTYYFRAYAKYQMSDRSVYSLPTSLAVVNLATAAELNRAIAGLASFGRIGPSLEPEEPEMSYMIPGTGGGASASGTPGAAGAASTTIGPPGIDAEEPEMPYIIPGTPAGSAIPGTPGAAGQSIPGLDAEEPEMPYIIPGRDGTNGSGGGGTATRVVVTAAFPAKINQRVNVVDASVNTTKKVLVWVSGIADGQANAGDLVDNYTMRAIANAGSFDLDMDFYTPWAGSLSVDYTIFA